MSTSLHERLKKDLAQVQKDFVPTQECLKVKDRVVTLTWSQECALVSMVETDFVLSLRKDPKAEGYTSWYFYSADNERHHRATIEALHRRGLVQAAAWSKDLATGKMWSKPTSVVLSLRGESAARGAVAADLNKVSISKGLTIPEECWPECIREDIVIPAARLCEHLSREGKVRVILDRHVPESQLDDADLFYRLNGVRRGRGTLSAV